MKEKLNAKTILVRVAHSGVIPELHYISGPIRRCRVDEKTLYRMVRNGKAIYELNPENPSEEVRLTIRNMMVRQFEKKESFTEASKKMAQEALKSAEEKTPEPEEDTSVEVETVVPEEVKAPQNNQNQNNNNYNGSKKDWKKNGKNYQQNHNKPNVSAAVESTPSTPDL